MTNTNIDTKVLQILKSISGISDLTDETELFKSGIIDSLGVVSLLVAIEEDLGVYLAITEFDRDELSTPQKISAYIQERL